MTTSRDPVDPIAEYSSHDDQPRRFQTAGTQHSQADSQAKKPFILKRWKDKLGLDIPTLKSMLKGAIPPTVALAMYQSDAVANQYGNLGYLVAIASMLSLSVQPRAKFIQTMILDILGVCIGASFALLMMYSSIKAREHGTNRSSATTQSSAGGTKVVPYNGSASAVVGIWLFFNIYLANTLRAFRPQYIMPTILYCIFINVAATYSTQFTNMTQVYAFVQQLLEAFLTGFGLATVTSFHIFPLTSRHIVFKILEGYVAGLKGALAQQGAYMRSLETLETCGPTLEEAKTRTSTRTNGTLSKPKTRDPDAERMELAEKLKGLSVGLSASFGKFRTEMIFARREVARGKLDYKDLKEIQRLFGNLHIPVVAMLTVNDLVERIAREQGWREAQGSVDDEQENKWNLDPTRIKKQQWNTIMQLMHEPFAVLTQAMVEGLDHALLILEISNPPKPKKSSPNDDLEARGDRPRPGQPGFATYFESQIEDYINIRGEHMKNWAEQKDMDLSTDNISECFTEHRRHQRHLFLVLYIEYLFWAASKAILELVRFADLKVADGTMKKKRLLFPNKRKMVQWIKSLTELEDSNPDHTPEIQEIGVNIVYVGDGLSKKKDPEHLPPANLFESATDKIRAVSHFLASPQSAFGFRAACAVMTIAIILFYRNTQHFFIEQRLFWSMIMVSISMTTTAGSGIFGFALRIFGTFAAMCASFIIWYIVDRHTAGILVFLALWLSCAHYTLLKFPAMVMASMISMITVILIIGYELQVRKEGVVKSTSNGQRYYPLYELAPYRLAVVCGGLAVAFVWTFFPYPITARSALRHGLGSALYLLANYYSCLHTTVNMRIQGREGDMALKTSPGRKLEKTRETIFGKEIQLINNLHQHIAFTKWEPTFGGKFPKDRYEDIVDNVQCMIRHLALISYSTQSFRPHTFHPTPISPNSNSNSNSPPNSACWLPSLLTLLSNLSHNSHRLTSTLSLLSSAVSSSNPLPPYLALTLPRSFSMVDELESLDREILGAKHVTEPGYTAFAVMQLSQKMVRDDLERLVRDVGELVGEVDFEFRVELVGGSTEGTTLTESSFDGEDGDDGDDVGVSETRLEGEKSKHD
ncbi:MAG: hypothetical protein M1834_004776 [Cirrosporium novae-zelandiae]|nr:MAG: hypothetical protein M1834_004776 [Cirrosporium novae-zelandiae]